MINKSIIKPWIFAVILAVCLFAAACMDKTDDITTVSDVSGITPAVITDETTDKSGGDTAASTDLPDSETTAAETNGDTEAAGADTTADTKTAADTNAGAFETEDYGDGEKLD